jgi:hypothetical protein
MELTEYLHCKLTDLDWEILEGLEVVLLVSYQYLLTTS